MSVISGQSRIVEVGNSTYVSLPLPSPLPLEVDPLNTAGERVRFASGVWAGAEPQRKSNLMNFSLKIWHLVAPILLIFLS